VSDFAPRVSLYPTGDIRSHVVGGGVILRSPDGNSHRIKVANDGSLSTEIVI